MSEESPQNKKEGDVAELTEQARIALIKSLSESSEIQSRRGRIWVNKENCEELIDDLTNKRPAHIGGPYWGEHLDGVLHDMGIEQRDKEGFYEIIWKKLESGE